MKKILFVATVEIHFHAFHIPCIKMLQKRGYEVHIATRLGPLRKELEEEGIICHSIEFARSPCSWRTWIALGQLLVLMRKFKFSLVHVHTPVGAFLGRLAAKLTGSGPVLYTAHGFHFFKGASVWSWLIYFNLERLAASWTDALLTINEEDYQTAQQKLHFVPGRTLYPVHGVGVDLTVEAEQARREVRSELGLDEDAIIVICVAELMPNKNQEFLLQAWRTIQNSSTKARLLLVGDGDDLVRLSRLVGQHQLTSVRFLGFRQDVPRLLSAADVAALLSFREGLPRAVMEAMAAGIPVIGSDIRGNRDLIEDQVTGFLVSLSDRRELEMRLEQLINDRELCARMGSGGREKVKLFSTKHVLCELTAIYQQFLNEGGGKDETSI